ncbi:guanylate kinase [Mycoplasma procyoni]|uniref:guanylate kinase n=1 Tax=Mycoplasma procyoni TaxID=568784 RepID=UPI00197C90A2|nr:guanylate kinase [Mycoplasma procyoni]MBN3534431.1 guanylate kinase [Mycoplasma procyoni]
MANKLVILAGPSGVGKGTIEKILFDDKQLNLKFSVSATTRKIREGEKDGIHYYFITKEDFQKRIDNQEFIEWNEHFNNRYGTLQSEIVNIHNAGFLPFLEVETIGALNVMQYYKDRNMEDSVISIFLAPPSMEELKRRILNRGTEDIEEIYIRIAKAEQEMMEIEKFKYVVINETPEQAAKEIKEIILGALGEN